MNPILSALKSVVPESVKEAVRSTRARRRNERFTPYLKKKTVEGINFDFWIGDPDGANWYDIHCGDPVWLEMRYLRDLLITEGDVVIECGGHHGCTAILLANWVGNGGKVVTFEASPGNCDIIAKNIALNNLPNLTLERKAVGAEQGKIMINTVSNASVLLAGRGVEVDMVRLDDYADLKPTLLKIDVEGFEGQVLRGARRILATRPKLAIEVHTTTLAQYNTSVEDIFRLIGIENYHCRVYWGGAEPPTEYDSKEPITKPVHLFCTPLP